MYKLVATLFFVIIAGDRCKSLADSLTNTNFETQCNVHCKELIANETRADPNHIQRELKAKLRRIERQLIAVQETLKNVTSQDFVEKEGSFKALQYMIKDTENQFNYRFTAIDGMLTKLDRKIIPRGFEKIGSRYFYIENKEKVTWRSAESICIELGGYLAAIKDQEELNLLGNHLDNAYLYWLGIYEVAMRGDFGSVTDKAKPFILWETLEPKYIDSSLHCVIVRNGVMYVDTCESRHYFFCQADDSV